MKLLLCLSALAVAPTLYAESRLKVVGLKKTSLSVIQREYELAEKVQNGSTIESNLQRRLLSMQIFSKVNVAPPDQNGILQVELEEKWTTIPVVKFSSGGGILQTTVGVYDPNLFGEFLESGIQYEQLGSEGSGVLWFKNPRFLNRPQVLDLQYWNTRRLRLKYDQNAIDPVEKQGFVLERERFYLGFEPTLNFNITLKFLIEQNKDRFSMDSLNDEQKRKFRGIELPADIEIYQVGFGFEWSTLNFIGHQAEGIKASALYKYHWDEKQVAKPFSQTDLAFHFSSLLDTDYNYVQRLLFSMTDTSLLQYWGYFGGLDRIRGFADNRFSGRYSLLSNSELRATYIRKPSWILQVVSFIDLLSSTEKFSELDRISAASAGVGFRIILPKIYRATLRLDYARPLVKDDEQSFGFGLQQFF